MRVFVLLIPLPTFSVQHNPNKTLKIIMCIKWGAKILYQATKYNENKNNNRKGIQTNGLLLV